MLSWMDKLSWKFGLSLYLVEKQFIVFLTSTDEAGFISLGLTFEFTLLICQFARSFFFPFLFRLFYYT